MRLAAGVGYCGGVDRGQFAVVVDARLAESVGLSVILLSAGWRLSACTPLCWACWPV